MDFAIMVHFSKSRGKFGKVGLSSIHSKHEKNGVFCFVLVWVFLGWGGTGGYTREVTTP